MEIKVSIICNTYNHEKYIKDALEGFIMQKTSFPFEVLIHDDASTDNTANIIREYEKKYPDIIKPIYETENQYSKGMGLVGKIQIARAQGKYIAICEGDDYWIDPYKLQKQYDAMEKYIDIDICAHKSNYINAKTNEILGEITPLHINGEVIKDREIIPIEDVIYGNGWYVYVATNSLFYRSAINKNMPEFRKMLSLDYTLQLHGSLKNGMLYLDDTMSTYRYMVNNSWTMTKQFASINSYVTFQSKRIKSLESLNSHTKYKYNEIITRKINEINFLILLKQRKLNKILKKPYIDIYRKKTFKQKLLILLKCRAPFIIDIYNRLNNKQ